MNDYVLLKAGGLVSEFFGMACFDIAIRKLMVFTCI